MELLNLESAKAYVRDYHARLGECADIEGAGVFYEGARYGCEIARLNVTVTDCASGDRYPAQWDVWVEGGALYGEF